MNARARQSSIERNHLRAYHRDIQDFLLKVNVNFQQDGMLDQPELRAGLPARDGAPLITVGTPAAMIVRWPRFKPGWTT